MIKLYINGTPGGTDGTEISSLTVKNLMSYMVGTDIGYYKSCAFIPICLREETGYTATDVQVAGKSSFTLSTPLGKSWPTSNLYTSSDAQKVGTVSNTNVLVLLAIFTNAAISSGTELFTISYVESVT